MKPKIIKSEAPRPLAHYNEGAQVGPWVFPAGQIASDYKTGVAPAARRNPGFPYYGSDIKLQTRYVLENLRGPSASVRSLLAPSRAGHGVSLPYYRCRAMNRQGKRCDVAAIPGKRVCRFHGGLSTGPKTEPGRARISAAQSARWRRNREARGAVSDED